MRVNADLDALDSELTEAARFRLANHGGVGLHLDVKEQTARVFDQFKKVAAEEHFAAAERQEKDASVRELIEDGLDLRGRHFAVVLSLIHISEPTRLLSISYAVFCLKKK